jgi:hypothetical protein
MHPMKSYLDNCEAAGRKMVSTGAVRDWSYLDGSMERYAQKKADGCFDGPHAERALFIWVHKEACDLFAGFADDTPENRASYAASLFRQVQTAARVAVTA